MYAPLTNQTSSSSSAPFIHSIIVVGRISLWKISLKCQRKLEGIVIAYHLKLHITVPLKRKLPPLPAMLIASHATGAQIKMRMKTKYQTCCNQNFSSPSFSNLKLPLVGFMNIQKDQSFLVHRFSHLPLGWDFWLMNVLFLLNLAGNHPYIPPTFSQGYFN